MALTSVSKSAFSRKGTFLSMKPGVQTLSVGTIDVMGITIDEYYSIDVNNEELQYTNGGGTRTFAYEEDLFTSGILKPELMPNIALTQVYDNILTNTELFALNAIQIGDIAIKLDDNLAYMALNGDNEDIGDWNPLSLSYAHPAKDVSGIKIINWDIGYDHSLIESDNAVDEFWNNVTALMNTSTVSDPAPIVNAKGGGAVINIKSSGGVDPKTQNLSTHTLTSLINKDVAYYMGDSSTSSDYGFYFTLGNDIATTGFIIEFWYYPFQDEATGIAYLADFRTIDDNGWQILIKGSNDSTSGDFYINVDNASGGEIDTSYNYKHNMWHYTTIQYIPISAGGLGKLEIWDYEQDRDNTQQVCQADIGVAWTDNQITRTLHLFDSWNSSGNTSTPMGYFQDIRVTKGDRGYSSVIIPEVPIKPFGVSETPVDSKNPHSLNAVDVGAISITGSDLLRGDIIPKYESFFNLGESSKRFSKLYVDSIYMGSSQNLISSIYDWNSIADFIKGTSNLTDSTGFSVYLKNEIDDFLPGSGGENPYLDLLSSTGGSLKMGDSSTQILNEEIIASISFVSQDSNVVQTDDTQPYFQLENTHAKIIAKITNDIENLNSNGQPNASGTWQRDVNIEFLTGKNDLSSTFRVLSDNTISIPLKSWRSTQGVWDDTIKPIVEDQVIKIFANQPDKSIYYNIGTANNTSTHEFLKLLYGYDVTDNNDNSIYIGDPNAQSANFNVVGTEEVNTKVLKINNKVVDLDNLITSYENWSENKVQIEIAQSASDINDIGDIVLEQITADTLMPDDAILLKMVILIRWRLTSNSHASLFNGLDGGLIQIKENGEGAYKTIKDYEDLSGSYYTPEDTSSSGDMIFLESTYNSTELLAFRDTLKTGNVTFNLILKNVKSLQDNLILRDFSWGIRKYWR